MLKIMVVAIVLLLVDSGLASTADIYKCTRPDGTSYFSNSAAQPFGDCLMEKVEDLPPLATIQDNAVRSAPSPVSKPSAAPAAVAGNSQAYHAFASEARQLVDQYKDAKRRSVHYSVVVQKQKALRELSGIRAKKTVMLGEIDQATIGDAEKQQLREVLSQVRE